MSAHGVPVIRQENESISNETKSATNLKFHTNVQTRQNAKNGTNAMNGTQQSTPRQTTSPQVKILIETFSRNANSPKPTFCQQEGKERDNKEKEVKKKEDAEKENEKENKANEKAFEKEEKLNVVEKTEERTMNVIESKDKVEKVEKEEKEEKENKDEKEIKDEKDNKEDKEEKEEIIDEEKAYEEQIKEENLKTFYRSPKSSEKGIRTSGRRPNSKVGKAPKANVTRASKPQDENEPTDFYAKERKKRAQEHRRSRFQHSRLYHSNELGEEKEETVDMIQRGNSMPIDSAQEQINEKKSPEAFDAKKESQPTLELPEPLMETQKKANERKRTMSANRKTLADTELMKFHSTLLAERRPAIPSVQRLKISRERDAKARYSMNFGSRLPMKDSKDELGIGRLGNFTERSVPILDIERGRSRMIADTNHRRNNSSPRIITSARDRSGSGSVGSELKQQQLFHTKSHWDIRVSPEIDYFRGKINGHTQLVEQSTFSSNTLTMNFHSSSLACVDERNVIGAVLTKEARNRLSSSDDSFLTPMIGNYSDVRLVGLGLSRRAYIGNDNNSVTVAIKEVDMCAFPYAYIEPAMKFIERVSRNSYPNVVNYHEAFIENNGLFVVHEMTACGSLSDSLLWYGPFSEDQVAQIVYQILSGIEQTRDLPAIYSLEPSDILLFEDGVVKIQFGIPFVRKLNTNHTFLHANENWDTQNIMLQRIPSNFCPECYDSKKGYSEKSISWLIGTLIIHLLTGVRPFSNTQSPLLNLFEMTTKDIALPKNISSNLTSFLLSCLKINPHSRISIPEMKTHPWMLKTATHTPHKRLKQISTIVPLPLYTNIVKAADASETPRLHSSSVSYSDSYPSSNQGSPSPTPLSTPNKSSQSQKSPLFPTNPQKNSKTSEMGQAKSKSPVGNISQMAPEVLKKQREHVIFSIVETEEMLKSFQETLLKEFEETIAFRKQKQTQVPLNSQRKRRCYEDSDDEIVSDLNPYHNDTIKLFIATLHTLLDSSESLTCFSSAMCDKRSLLDFLKSNAPLLRKTSSSLTSLTMYSSPILSESYLSPSAAAEEKKMAILIDSIRKLSQYFVSHNEVLKMAQIVYKKPLNELTFSCQGELLQLQARNLHGASKWKNGYYMLKDNFLFIKGSRNQIIDAIYLNTTETREFFRDLDNKPFCFSVDTYVFSVPNATILAQWTQALNKSVRWFEVSIDEVSVATLLAYQSQRRENSKKDLFVPDITENINPVFGFPIVGITEREKSEIPTIISKLTNFILCYGLDEEDIFRKRGREEDISSLQEKFDKNLIVSLDGYDIHTICSVLISFFAQLPSPIVPPKLVAKTLPILRQVNVKFESHLNQSLHQVSAFLKAFLPLPDYLTLQRVFYVLLKLYENKTVNHVSVRRLHSSVNKEGLRMPYELFSTFIKHFHFIFDDFDPTKELRKLR